MVASRLIPLTVVTPGFLGVNKQQANNPNLGLEWATEALNCVIDVSGRLAARKGWNQSTLSPISGTPDIEALGEYIDITGTAEVISAAELKLFSGTGVLTEVTGTITTPTANNWLFLNFNNKLLGFQEDHNPIVYTGTSFANIVASDGTVPTGHAALSAYGRIWSVESSSDKTILKWCDTLLETVWGSGLAGSLDLKTVWGDGIDEITALASFQGFLVIFGKKSILLYANPEDPVNIVLADHIKGIGCVSRDSVQDIGTDILFLSDSGVRSLGRTIVHETSPIGEVSRNVRDELLDFSVPEVKKVIRSVFHEPEGFYLITFPTAGFTFCFDLKRSTPDEQPRVTIWDGINPKAFLSSRDGSLYLGQPGVIGFYDDNYSDNGASYLMSYRSTWTSINDRVSSVVKIPKRVVINGTGGFGYTIDFKFAFDFIEVFNTINIELEPLAALEDTAQYGLAEYGLDEYGGAGEEVFNRGKGSMKKSGRLIKFGIDVNILNQPLSISKIDILTKVGRVFSE